MKAQGISRRWARVDIRRLLARASKDSCDKDSTAGYRLEGRSRPYSIVWRWGPLVVLVTCAVLSLGAEAESGSLSFVEETPLNLSLVEAREGANVGICNLGESPVQDVRLQTRSFDPPLKLSNKKIRTLAADDCGMIMVKMKQDKALLPGKYQGLLLLSATGVTPVTRQVVIEVRGLSAAAKPIRVTKWWPSNITRLESPPCIVRFWWPPVEWPPCIARLWWPPVKEVELPLRSKDKTALEVEKRDALGFLSGGFGNGHARVVAAEKFQGEVRSRRAHSLTVRVKGLEGVGTYTGTLTIDEVDYEVEMLVSDFLLWAVLALLMGLVLAGLALFAAKNWVPNSRLKGRCSALEQRYQDELTKFRNELPNRQEALTAADVEEEEARRIIGKLHLYEIDDTNVRAYQKRFGQLLSAYRKRNVFFDTSAEDYKQLLEVLESAEEDYGQLGDSESLGKSLQDLALALYQFDEYLKDKLELPPGLRPALIAPAAAKLNGGRLKVGAAKEISEQAKGYTDLIASWRKSLNQIIRYYVWAARIEYTFRNMDSEPPEDDWKALRTTAGKLVEALNELFDAEDAAALKELGTTEDLKESYKTLAALGGKYNVWLVVVEQDTDEERFKNANEVFASSPASSDFAGHFFFKEPSDAEEHQSIADVAAKTPFESPSPRPRSVNVRPFSPIGTAVLSVSLALLIALVATFVGQVYPDASTPFGTTKDYLAAIAAGATGAAISNFLQAPLTSLLTRLRPGS